MFTGLVEGKVTLVDLQHFSNSKRMGFDLNGLAEGVKVGDSIALNGCCLTVVQIKESVCWFELGSETLGKTNLGQKSIGDQLNCERSLRVGDRMGGHFVTGHIDGLGTLKERRDEGPWSFLSFAANASLLRQMVSKGSIAIDGVSLTLVDVTDASFSVALIPHTLDVTTLGQICVGSTVNLETDLLAKYAQKALQTPPN